MMAVPSRAPLAQVAQWCGAIVSEGETLHGAHAWDDQQAFGELMRMGPEGRSMLYPRLRLVPGGQGRVAFAMNGRVRGSSLVPCIAKEREKVILPVIHSRPVTRLCSELPRTFRLDRLR